MTVNPMGHSEEHSVFYPVEEILNLPSTGFGRNEFQGGSVSEDRTGSAQPLVCKLA